MDPFSALGLTSSLLTFIDFAGKFISGGLEIYYSAHGTSTVNQTVEDVTRDLKDLCNNLGPTTSTGSLDIGEANPENALLPLATSCTRLGGELFAILEALKVQGRRTAWKCARQALRSALKAGKIKIYQGQLDDYKSQLAMRLLSLMWFVTTSLTKHRPHNL